MEIGKNLKDLLVTLSGLGVACFFAWLGYERAAIFIGGGAFGYGIKNGVQNAQRKNATS